MRVTLYGQGEGVRAENDAMFWASVKDDLITDASISARKRGVCAGMRPSVAQALIPQLTLCAESETPTAVMQNIWAELWSFSPWLQTVDNNAFFLQVSGISPPLKEVCRLLHMLDSGLSTEQRLRVGCAETPLLAQALVEWSRLEKVPGAVYRKANRQQLILSPGLTHSKSNLHSENITQSCHHNREMDAWTDNFPIQALWLLPAKTRAAMLELGIYRLSDLRAVSKSLLRQHFGVQSLLWASLLHQSTSAVLERNYPPERLFQTWRAKFDEEPEISCLPSLVEMLLVPLCASLSRTGMGALKLGMAWQTNAGDGVYQRVLKGPLCRRDSLLAQLQPGYEKCAGERIEKLELFVEDLKPLSGVQLSFVIRGNSFVAADSGPRQNLRKVLQQVNRKFPERLQIGVRPSFRELRIQALFDSTGW